MPPHFRFSAKLPRTITHERRLRGARPLLDDFLVQAGGLGDRLGCLLVQLPPSLAFDARMAGTFFAGAGRRRPGASPGGGRTRRPCRTALEARVSASLPPRGEAWVIFDNTAHGHATPNAAGFQDLARR